MALRGFEPAIYVLQTKQRNKPNKDKKYFSLVLSLFGLFSKNILQLSNRNGFLKRTRVSMSEALIRKAAAHFAIICMRMKEEKATLISGLVPMPNALYTVLGTAVQMTK